MTIPPRLRRVRQCGHSFGLHQVHFHGNNLLVTVTKRAAEVDEWVNEILHNYCHALHNLVVGLDIEWHPCSEGEHNPAATLQLCVGERCLIFLLLHKDFIPRSLLAFLAHPRFTFVGVGVQDDADKLLQDHGLAVTNVADLRRLAEMVYRSEEYRRMGLKKMAWRILGRVMEKPREVTLSNWDSKNLTFPQIEYGCIDAFVSFELGFNLFAMAYTHHIQ
ncbi:Werner Syndrome-like exonuclease [Ipomoea triloba]|uniref:Werner Syndrome-like exonuclease n=1 Tax=Ipomoea triloba TaxID=35885 RepID=UPI00125DA3E9|nr:Werner Syndrome-like exonuclease [Ipomoea triloba]